MAECAARSADGGRKGSAGRGSRGGGEYVSVGRRREGGVSGTCSRGMRPRGVGKNGPGECVRGGVANGGKRVCEKGGLGSGMRSIGGKGRLKVNSRDGIAGAAAGEGTLLGWEESFEVDHEWGGWLEGDDDGNRGANGELAPGTPGPDRCPIGLVLVPVTDGPIDSSREEESWPALKRMKGAGGAM